ncbi:MAG TPA: ankyrin repeat domain-containing protein [Allosphingosinicella sp.]
MTHAIRAGWIVLGAAIFACGACGTVVNSQHNTAEYTPLDAAATSGDVATVGSALDRNPSLIRSTEWNGESLLHDAVANNQEAMARFLLVRGADVNALDKSRLAPLHIAAQNGNVPIIRLLVAHGAHLNARDARGWTPLDRAMKWHHAEAAEALRSLGARATVPDGSAPAAAPAPPAKAPATAH